MKNKMYGEVKTRKNIFPKDAREFVEKGTIDILIIQAKASLKTKSILDEGNIILYKNVEPSEIINIREQVAKEIEFKKEKELE